MSKAGKEIRRFGRRIDKNIIRPVYKNIVRPVFRPIEKNIFRPVFKELERFGPKLEKGLRGAAAIALPVVGGLVGGPLGAAAGLQLSAQTPYIKKGWKDVTREVGNATGIDWIKENPYRVAGIGAGALGAYGLANLAATGSTGWGWGSGVTQAGGAGSGIGGTTAGQASSAGAGVAKRSVPALQGGFGGGGVPVGGSTISSGATLAPAAAGGASTVAPYAGSTALMGGFGGGGTAVSLGSSGSGWLGTLGSGAAAAGSAIKGAMGPLSLGLMAYNMMNQPKPPAVEQYIPDYSGLVVSGGGLSEYDMMGGEYGQQWQEYIDELSRYADEQRDLYDQYANPVQKKYLEMVEQGIDPDLAASMAGTGVMQEYDATRQMLARQQSAMGINPSSPLYQSQQADLAASQALGQAQAMTQARQGAANMNMGLLQQGAQYAMGLGSNVANIYGNLASQSGSMAGMYASGARANAEIASQNAAMMTQANIAYASQFAQAQIQQANMNYTARLQNSYGLSNLAGQIFSNWLFGGSNAGASGSSLFI